MKKTIAILKKRYSVKSKFKKNIYIIIDFLGVLMLWRGGWGLLDLYIFPNNQLLSYVVTIAIGFGLLLMDGDGLEDLSR